MIANRPPDNESLVGTEMKVKFLQADKADQRIILSNRPRATQILNLSGNLQGISWNIGWETDFRLSSFRAAFFHCLRWKIKYMSICSWDFFFRNSLIMHCRIMSVLLSRVHRTSFENTCHATLVNGPQDVPLYLLNIRDTSESTTRTTWQYF